MLLRSSVLVFLLLALISFSAGAGTRRFAVVIGNNLGHDEGKKLRYAEYDAEKFHKVLLEIGGFSKSDTRLVLGRGAEQAWKAVRDTEARIKRLADNPEDKILFVFYYSGHAEGDMLEMGSSSFMYGDLLKFLKDSAADVRLAFVDSCKSGSLIAMKGGRRGPGYDIKVTDEITSSGYGIITSSSDNELSQESAEIRGAYFTHYLVSALRGAGDRSGDGKVTLNEAYHYAYAHTLARTSTTIGGSQHPMYEFQLEGRGEIILTNTDISDTHLMVELPEEGRLVVLDQSSRMISLETGIRKNTKTLLALRPGTYTLYFVDSSDRVFSAHKKLAAGSAGSVSYSEFEPAQLELSTARGGFFEEPADQWVNRIGVGGLWRLWPLEGGISSYGASVHYRIESPDHWQPAIRLTWSTREDAGASTGYNDIGVMAGMGYVLSFEHISLRGEILAGYEHMLQDSVSGESRHTSGFDYAGLVGAEVPVDSVYFALDAAAGGRVFQIMDKGWVHRPDCRLVLSLGWKWII